MTEAATDTTPLTSNAPDPSAIPPDELARLTDDIVAALNLKRPIYRQTTNYGHFGKLGMPWESTAKVAALKAALR